MDSLSKITNQLALKYELIPDEGDSSSPLPELPARYDRQLSYEVISRTDESLTRAFDTPLFTRTQELYKEKGQPVKKCSLEIPEAAIRVGQVFLYKMLLSKLMGHDSLLHRRTPMQFNVQEVRRLSKTTTDIKKLFQTAIKLCKPGQDRNNNDLEVELKEFLNTLTALNMSMTYKTSGLVFPFLRSNHEHIAACIFQDHLLGLLQRLVIAGEKIGTKSVAEILGVESAAQLTHEYLRIREKRDNSFGRDKFDNFEDAFNIADRPEARREFLKIRNTNGGKYFAELIKSYSLHQAKNNVILSPRISFGNPNETLWLTIALWAHEYDMLTLGLRFFIQINRRNKNFDKVLEACFEPLLRYKSLKIGEKMSLAGTEISDEQLNILGQFWQHLWGFDLVGLEESGHHGQYFDIYNYIRILNMDAELTLATCTLRKLAFEPHSGEFLTDWNMEAAAMLSTSILHGFNFNSELTKILVLYEQIPLHQAFTSNNYLSVKIEKHPSKELLPLGFVITANPDDTLVVFDEVGDPLRTDLEYARKGLEMDEAIYERVQAIMAGDGREKGLDISKRHENVRETELLKLISKVIVPQSFV